MASFVCSCNLRFNVSVYFVMMRIFSQNSVEIKTRLKLYIGILSKDSFLTGEREKMTCDMLTGTATVGVKGP